MSEEFERSVRAAEAIRDGIAQEPNVLLVLGSGLGAFADTLNGAVAIPYGDIPGFAVSSVVGHAGRLVIGERHGRIVAAMQGRVHAYEGHTMCDVVLPVRTLWQLGVRTMIVTNAVGSIADSLTPGDLMLIDDHLNLTGTSPLVGPNDERFGPRFPDMSEPYSARLRGLTRDVAAGLRLPISSGVYAGVLGPAYETPAEVRMLRTLGADVVGMSTVPEVIAARHLGVEVLGISCVTNFASGLGEGPLSHSEVTEVASRSRSAFIALLDGVLAHPSLTE